MSDENAHARVQKMVLSTKSGSNPRADVSDLNTEDHRPIALPPNLKSDVAAQHVQGQNALSFQARQLPQSGPQARNFGYLQTKLL